MRIGIDVDGVLRNLYIKLVEVYLREFPDGWCRPVSEWHQYNIDNDFSIGKDIYDFWFNSKHTKEIYMESPSFSGIDIIDQIAEDNEIEIITNQPNPNTAQYTLQWLQNLNIPYNGLHFTKDKEFIDCDIYVDDSAEQILNLRNENKRVAVVDQPWNNNGQLTDEDIIRVKDFYEFGTNVLKGEY